jgi:tetratricopeptide (TPR) repeat protein
MTRNHYEVLQAYVGACMELKQPDKALAKLKLVIADNPRYAGAYQLAGVVHLAQKRESDGVKALNQAMDIEPRWPGAYTSLGRYYEQAKKPDLAAAVYRKALAAVPNDAPMLLNLARAYEEAKQYEQAAALYEDLLKAQPDNLLAINNLASLLSLNPSGEANLQRARALAVRLEASPEPAFQDTLAWVYHLSGESAKAMPLELKVVEKLPNIPIFKYHLGAIYAKQGDTAKAKEYLAKAVAAQQDFPGSADAKSALQNLR